MHIIKQFSEAGGGVVLLAAFTGINLGLSVLVQVKMAEKFGLSIDFDAYVLAWAAPAVLLGLSTTIFDSVVIPTLRRLSSNQSDQLMLQQYLVDQFGKIIFWLSLCGLLLTPFWFHLSGADETSILELAYLLAAVNWSAVFFALIASLRASFLKASRRFFVTSALALLPHALMLFALIIIEKIVVIHVAIAMTVAYAIQFILLSFLNRNKGCFEIKEIIKSEIVKKILHAIPLASCALLPFVFLPFIDSLWFKNVDVGGYSALGYCQRILVAIYSLVGQAIFTALLPALSMAVADNNHDEYSKILKSNLNLAIWLVIPISFSLIVYPTLIVSTLFERGSFDAEATERVSRLLQINAFGLFGYILHSILLRCDFSRSSYRRSAITSFLALCGYGIFSGMLSSFYGELGFAIASVLFWTAIMSISIFNLRKIIFFRSFLIALICSIACSFFSYHSTNIFLSLINDSVNRLTPLIIFFSVFCISAIVFLKYSRKTYFETI